MSRGPGKVQRWVLAELAKPTPAWPPWITVETLAARYLGLADGELVAAVCKDDTWRSMATISAGHCGKVAPEEPRAYDHLVGLSVESATHCSDSQRLWRSGVESVRRAVKGLAAAGLIDVRHLRVDGRGGAHTTLYRDSGGNRVSWDSRGHVDMLACRRLLTETEAQAEAPRVAERMTRAKQAMAMLKSLR